MKMLATKWVTLPVILIWLCSGMSFSQTPDRLVIGESSDVDQLNPLTNFSATGSYLNEYLFFSLLRTDKSNGKFVPLLAENLPKVSQDKLNYTYQIHPAAKFNSGKKLTGKDVVFSLKMVKNPFVQNSQKRIHYAAVAGAEVVENGVVQIRLRKRSSQGLRITSDFAVLAQDVIDPEGQMDQISFADLDNTGTLPTEKVAVMKLLGERINAFGSNLQTFNNAAISGPYMLSEWTLNQKIVLEANKKFWGKKVGTPNMFFKQNVATLEFVVYENEQEIRSAIFNGKVDLFTSLPANLYFELSDIPKLRDNYVFHSPPQNSYEYVSMNIRGADRGRSPVFAEVEVRRAMAHFLDVELLLEEVRYGLGERLAADYPAYRPGFRNEELELIGHDPARAKELLEKAGWKDSNGNGLLDKKVGGETVEFVVECIYNSNKPARLKIAEALQQNARKAGVLVSIEALPWKAYLSRMKKGDFDIAIGAWATDPNEDSYAQIWHSKNWGSGSNFIGFGDAESDGLIEAYDATMDRTNRRSISFQIQRKIARMQPYIFLWVNTQCIVMRKGTENGNIYLYRPGFWLGEWN